MTPFLDALWEILNPSLDTVSVTLLIYNKNKVRNTGFILSCSSQVQPIRAREVMAAGAGGSCRSHPQPGSRDGQTLVLFLASLLSSVGMVLTILRVVLSTSLATPRNSQTSPEWCLLGDSRSYRNC